MLKQISIFIFSTAFAFGCTTTETDPQKLDIELKKGDQAAQSKTTAPTGDWQSLFKPTPNSDERQKITAKLATWKDSDQSDVLLKKARGQVALGFLKDAETTYRELLRQHDNSLEGMLELSQLYLRMHRPERAIEFLAAAREKIMAQAEPSESIRYQYKFTLALAMIATGDTPKAHEILSELVAADKNFSPAYAALANSYLNHGNTEAAVFILQRGIDRGQEDPRLYNLLGVACEQRKKYDDAKTWYEKSLAIGPTFFPALINRGNLSMRQGEISAAKADLEKAVELAPDSVEALVSLGILRKNSQQANEAEQLFVRAIEINPENGYARYNLALLLAEKSAKPNEALRLFHEVIQAREGSEELRGLAKLQIENLKDAMAKSM